MDDNKPLWERLEQLSPADREEFDYALRHDWTEINEFRAETEAGQRELHRLIIMRYTVDKAVVGMI